MGNSNNGIAQNQQDNNQQLIQDPENDISLLVEQPSIKKIYAIKNPVYLKKETLALERDSENPDLFYIKFYYDSLLPFNLYINFDVTRNKEVKQNLLPNSEYIPCYTPSEFFKGKMIAIENLVEGQNIEFFDPVASLNIKELNQNKTNEEHSFDVSIEMVPLPSEELIDNEIIHVTLCKIIKEENEAHNHKIRPELQRIKTQTMWIDMHDVFNCALDSGECLICCSALRNTIFLPCKHSCTCNSCAHSLRMRNNPCPICKNQIDDLVILESEDEKRAQEEIDKLNAEQNI